MGGEVHFSDSSDIKLSLENHNGKDIIQITPLFFDTEELPIAELLMLRTEVALFLRTKEQRGEHYTWEMFVMELLNKKGEVFRAFLDGFTRILKDIDFSAAWRRELDKIL